MNPLGVELRLDLREFERRAKKYIELVRHYEDKNLSIPEIAALERITIIYGDALDFNGEADDACWWNESCIFIDSSENEKQQKYFFFRALSDIILARQDKSPLIEAKVNGTTVPFYTPKPKSIE